MIGTSAALLGSGAIGLGSGILSGILGSSAADKAAQAQKNSQQQVIDNTKGTVAGGQSDITNGEVAANTLLGTAGDKQTHLYDPYVSAGTDSLTGIQKLTAEGGPLDQQFSFGAKDLEADPGYQFALNEGNKAIARAGSAKGNLFSAATLKKISDYNVGSASTHFNEAFGRAQSTFDTNRSTALSRIGSLQSLASMGLQGTQGQSNAISGTASQEGANVFNSGTARANLGMSGNDTVSRALTGKGDSQAAGIVGGANAVSNGLGTGLTALQQFLTLRGFGLGGGTNPNPGSGIVPTSVNPYPSGGSYTGGPI